MSKEETITLKKETLWKGGFFVLLIILGFVLIGGFGSFGGSGSGSGNGGAGNGGAVAPTVIKISEDSMDPVLGDSDASITVYEFSDFQCPFCARAASTTVAELKASSLFTSGEINFVYRHFPLNSIHPHAQKAAEASECANRQDKFWEYHDMLFANQGALDTVSLKSYAVDLGLDTNAFNACLDGGEAAAKVAKDLKSATDAGGRGTPYFVVYNKDNGETAAVSGAVPFSQVESAINAVK